MSDGERGATIVTVPGARAAEQLLLAEVCEAIARRDGAIRAALARSDAAAARALLARPLRIVVPSRSLREHVTAALLRKMGRAVAAVSVHTHWALAWRAIERAGEAPPTGDALFGVAVRRAAREEPSLLRALGDARDGFGVVEAAARDLADAGFLPVHADALDEALAATGTSEATERARAAVRATGRALTVLAGAGLAPRAALLQRAAELVAARGPELLPTAGLWLHGFTDATGVLAEWLVALLRAFGGSALVDTPPDPFAPGRVEAEFAKPLVERLAAVARRAPDPVAPAPPARIALVRAPGAIAEVRAVATRIRALLDGGVAPESIGVVTREAAPYRAAIGSQLARLAIPFSTHGFAAAPDANTGRVAALARLLAEAERAPLDVWLAASAHEEDASSDLRVGLHVLGLGRIGEFATLDLERALAGKQMLVLPVRQGSSEDGESTEAVPETGRRRRVRPRLLRCERLAAAQERARSLAGELAAWPERARFDAHRSALARLLESRLGWRRDDAVFAAIFAALDELDGEIPAALELARDELALVVGRALEAAAERPVGGRGAGVQVLTATAARGRCFEHLFVLGLNRDVFPRRPVLDPLLPDRLRQALASLLVELPIKSRARAEERHLFAELLSASPQVTLSWQFASDEGRECARSSFIERLRQVEPSLPDATVVALERDPAAPRRAHEHAIRAALCGPRAELAPIRSAALGETRAAVDGGFDPDALAATQIAVLAELDPDLADRRVLARLSPYGGRIGARADGSEPTLYVTALESVARCPWQAFLRRDLGLEPVPDALEALPSLSPLLLGTVVHAVLERIAREAGAATQVSIVEALAHGVRRVVWPDAAQLDAIVRSESEQAANGEGIRSASFVRALARSAARALDVARETEWRDPAGVPVVGAELSGAFEIADATGRVRPIGFRADRVDASAELFRVTDYKTGKVPSDKAKAETRRKHLLAGIEQGRFLQAVAYLGAAAGRDVTGRFLFLRPEADPAHREHEVTRGDGDLVAAFTGVAHAVLAARSAGALPPRLLDPKEDKAPRACTWCEVSAACLQGESGVRRRQRDWLEQAARDETALAPDERAAVALLLLGHAAREEDA